MIACLSHHHNPETVDEDKRPLVATVALANLYANIFEIGSAGDIHQEVPVVDQIIAAAGMEWSRVAALHPTVLAEIEKAQIFLQITKE